MSGKVGTGPEATVLAANIMAESPVLKPEESLFDAVRAAGSAGAAGAMPVVDDDKRVVGVVNAARLVKLLFDNGKARVSGIPGSTVLQTSVKDFMEKEFAAAMPDAPAFELAATLSAPDIESIMVVDNNFRLLGVVTRAGLLKRLWEYTEKRR